MKKITLLFTFSVLLLSLGAQIPNAGFEDWTSMGSYNNPNDWGTLNDVTMIMSTFTCAKGSPGNPGSSYIKLTSKTVTGMGIVPGIALTGNVDIATLSLTGGFPYTSRPVSLAGNWQYMAFGSDQGFIAVYLSKWNTASHSRDSV